MATTLHVISHTHWDREWYLTFQQFRLRLVDLIDHLLDILEADPSYRHFNLDAQTIVLDDYLAIRPHARERLTRHIREGRITIGPWYELNDEFLTSAEATVRSLLIGHRMAAEYGPTMKIGYLPDQFGNISQMPQILRGFGIDNAVMGRGYQLVGDRQMEFWWEGPDGSRVLSSLMAFWYNNAQYIPADRQGARQALERIVATMKPRSATGHLLLMNGVDHLEPLPWIGGTIRELAADDGGAGGEWRIAHTTLPAYVDALRAAVADLPTPLAVRQGELREDRGGACLAGTLSSRIYLKQENARSQAALEHDAERLAGFARILGSAYPRDEMLYAWKLLLQNHPHDSICGCSIDQVHREMMPRFAQVRQVADELADRALDHLFGRDRAAGAQPGSTSLAVVNTLNWERTDPVEATLVFALGPPARSNPRRDDAAAPGGFRLVDADGAEVPFAVVGIETGLQTVLSPVELPLDQWVRRVRIEFVARAVPPCGYREYRIVPQAVMPEYALAESSGLAEELRALCLEDVGDVGDEYLHRKPLADRRVLARAEPSTGAARLDSAARARTRVAFTLDLPASGDAAGRSSETVACPIVVTATRWAGVPRVEYRIEVDNRARDHRLRAMWDAGAGERAAAEGQYDVIERPIRSPLEAEGASPFHPQQTWVDVSGPRGGRAILNLGLPEYEVYEEGTSDAPRRSIAVTLLRCVGQLSGRGDGPGTRTPDAQCPGPHAFELAVFDHAGGWEEARVWQQAHQLSVPLRAVQCAPNERRPAERSFVRVEPAELVVSAVKGAEDRDSLVVRLYNTTHRAVSAALVQVEGARRMRPVTLNEEPVLDWTEGGAMRLDVGPAAIVTLECELAARASR